MFIHTNQSEFQSKPSMSFPFIRMAGAVVAAFCAASLAAATFNVATKDNFFSPKSVTIAVGDTVVWTNQGSRVHTVTSGTGCDADGLFDSGGKDPGETFSHTFDAAGTIPYFCIPHCPSMAGTVVVKAGSPLGCSASASPMSGPAPLTVAFSGSAGGGTMPYSYAWDFGDGQASSSASAAHTYTGAGSYAWSMTVSDAAGGSCRQEGLITVESVPPPRVFLSGAARATGDQGTNWRTDIMLFNPGTADLAYGLYYTPSGADGTATPYSHSGVLGPGEAPLLTNFVETLFGLTNSAGSVRFQADGPLSVTSRTYNDTGEGTYGQFVPGQTSSAAAVGAVRSADDAELIGLDQNDRFRVNLGFSEVAGGAVTVLVRFFDAAGAPLGDEIPVPMNPYSWAQKSLPELGLPAADDVRAEVRVQGAGAVLAYASQVDNNTGDAVFQPARKPADLVGVDHQLIAAIAKAQGGFETNWLTDLILYNPSAAGQTAGLEYRSPQGTFSASLTLAAGEVRTVTDAVASLFPGAGGNTAGALHVTSGQGLLLASRTYNQASPTKTYGQFVPALGADLLVPSGAGGNILQIIHNADYRTNIGFSDLSGTGAEVAAVLHNPEGDAIAASETLTVPPGGNLQQSLNTMFGTGHTLAAGRVSFEVVGGGPVYGYASVADNRTGDAVFVPAVP